MYQRLDDGNVRIDHSKLYRFMKTLDSCRTCASAFFWLKRFMAWGKLMQQRYRL